MSALVAYDSSDEDEDEQVPVGQLENCQTTNTDAATSEKPLSPPPAHCEEQRRAHVEPAPGPTAGPLGVPTDSQADSPFDPYTYERQRLRELTMPHVPNFDIPDSPRSPTPNSEEAAILAATTKKFERFLELKRQGVHFNERLQNSASLRNPSLLPKLMDFAGISQEESYASSLSDGIAVPVRWPEQSYIEGLMRENEKRGKKRLQERDRVDFVPANANGNADSVTSSASGKSKFRRE